MTSAGSVVPDGHGLRAVAAGAIAFLGGIVASAFTAGPALFSDGHFAERPPVLVVSMTAFGVLGAGISLLAPRHWKAVVVGLIAASFLVVWFFGRDVLHDPKMAVLAMGFAFGDAAAGASGSLLGAWGRRGVK